MKLHPDVKDPRSIRKFKTLESDCNMTHNNKYDYSQSVYLNVRTPMDIICPTHGLFQQTIKSHILDGNGCPQCASESRFYNIQEWISKADIVHNKKYDYSQVNYENSQTKIDIICSEHGIFKQLPASHLKGIGCPQCGINNRKYNANDFITKADIVHNKKYDYSQVNYMGSSNKVDIICPTHGLFQQTAKNHLSGSGCYECARSIINKNGTRYHTREIYHNQDTILYLIEFDNGFVKVGLTKSSVENRYRYEDINFKIIKEWKFPSTGQLAFDAEAIIKKRTLTYRLRLDENKMLLNGGNSEIRKLSVDQMLEICSKTVDECLNKFKGHETIF